MFVINKVLLAEFMSKLKCEWCKKTFGCGLDPHHLFTRAAGRLDIRTNLVSLCRQCHSDFHDGHIEQRDLLKLVEKREKIHDFEILMLRDILLHLPKDPKDYEVAAALGYEYTPTKRVASMVRELVEYVRRTKDESGNGT